MPDTTIIYPEQASTFAESFDPLYWTLVVMSFFFLFAVTGVGLFLIIRYRKDAKVNRDLKSPDYLPLELTWTIIPTILALGLFFWSATVYFDQVRMPEGAMNIDVVGKQWMWKIQHPNGRREVNELHIPVGRPIKLTMTSQDVIHSFFIPAFRIKKDVLPNRYTTLWFEATKKSGPEGFHLFCAEYCGAEHSLMGGKVYVMEPADYERWLNEGNALLAQSAPASKGEALFAKLGCAACHDAGAGSRGPELAGVFGKSIDLYDGSTVVADEDYLRESIMEPTAKVVSGFSPLMPSFKTVVNQEDLAQIITYIKSLADEEGDQTS
jgi:cytochrome c oxidase subunit II